MYAAGDVRVENVVDAAIEEPTDAVVGVTRACICGSDLCCGTPTRPTAPPGRAMPIAVSIDAPWPTHSSTECTPSPPVSSRTRSTASTPRSETTSVAPKSRTEMPGSLPAFFGNITIGGGPAPVRAYLDELLPDVLEGRIDPGRVFDRTVGLDGVPDGYRAMANRESIKVMVSP